MASSSFSSRRIVALLAATALVFMTLDARASGPFAGARSATLAATGPIRSAISWVASPISSGWQGVVHYDDVQADNDRLRIRIAELEGELAQAPDNADDLRALRQAVGIEFAEDFDRVTGQVVSDRQTGLERIIEIDVGSDDGVKVAMPVVLVNGLVGQVVSVSGGKSAVRVVTDPRLRVGVISSRTRVVGVTSGLGEGETLILDLLDDAQGINLDRARFVTSGFEGSPFPGGIPVGVLIRGENNVVSLRPRVDLEQLSFLTVILYSQDADAAIPLDTDSPAIVTEESEPGQGPATAETVPDTTQPADSSDSSEESGSDQ